MFNGKALESVTASRDIAVIPDHLTPNFLESRVIGNFPHARCIADSSASLDYAIGARYHLSRRQDSPLIITRQQAHPAQEEVQYEAEVSAPVHSRN
jgi:hypothetical protein